MDQPPGMRPSIWRFSLRELFLLVLAAAGFMGWAAILYRSGHLKPTDFFTTHESWQADVAAVLQELDEPPFQGSAGTIMHSDGQVSVQRTFVFRIPLAAEKQQLFFSAFKTRVRRALKESGCKVVGESGSSVGDYVSVIGYTHDPVAGTIQICIGDVGKDRASIVLTMQEQRAADQSFGLESSGQ